MGSAAERALLALQHATKGLEPASSGAENTLQVAAVQEGCGKEAPNDEGCLGVLLSVSDGAQEPPAASASSSVPAELAVVVESWARLPGPIRDGILALVRSTLRVQR